MAKTISIHMLELCPGVKGDDFEKFVKEEVYPRAEWPKGYKGYLYKGAQGDEEGKYLWAYEYESVELRNKALADKWWETPTNKEIFAKWDTFECRFNSTYTLYIAVE